MRERSVLMFSLLALVAPVGAQTPETPALQPVQAFEEAIDVRVVNLEAVVTDGKGKRVSGLSLQDFKLRVDGTVTPIGFFAEIDERKRPAVGETAQEAAPDATAETAATATAEPTWQSRNVLVFLDEATMLKARRDIVLRSMRRQLDRLAPGDRMAVVAFDGSRLETLSDWTADRARLASVFAAVKARPSRGIYREASRRQDADDQAFAIAVESEVGQYAADPLSDSRAVNSALAPRGSIAQPGLVSLSPPARTARLPTELFNPLDRFLEVGQAAAAAMRGLPAPEGRKMLMLLTEGFPDPFFARPVVQEAGRLGYSLYPVDVQGIDTFQATNDVENDGPVPFQFISTEGDRRKDFTFEAMAAATGGKAALNSNRLAALERLVEDSATYYLLGFSPTWRGDDRRHRVELTLDRPGLKVRTRNDYVDASRRTRLSLEANATLLFGRSQSEPKLVLTSGGTVSAGGKERISLALGVPVESLAFYPQERGFRAEAPVALVALDDKGKRQELPGTWLAVNVAKLPLQGTYVRANFTIPAETRARRIVATVHDALSGEALWGEVRLDPPRAGEASSPHPSRK